MQVIRSVSYQVHFTDERFRQLNAFLAKSKYSSFFILCDENTLQHCLPLLISACPLLSEAEIIETDSGEASKSLDTAALICQTLLEKDADRQSLFINLGGGVISDLGGFCASIYKRGIHFINIPTSLLAMADASVGGKTGVDFCGVKNILGTFHQPQAVFIHEGFLGTLPKRHFKNGLAEIYKMALISDKKLWNQFQGMDITNLVHRSVVLKNNIVLKDPFDKGLRQQLNFGHTLGHALEALLLSKGLDVLHGEAITAGMIMEAHLAWQKKMLDSASLKMITATLSSELNRPDAIFTFDELLPFLASDKKNKDHKVRFSLLNGIGKCKTGMTATAAQIKKSITHYHQINA